MFYSSQNEEASKKGYKKKTALLIWKKLGHNLVIGSNHINHIKHNIM